MHYYQFAINEYQSHTAHLDHVEDIAYRRMMDWAYLHERPLPIDPEEICRLIRMRTQCDSIRIVLREFWVLHEDGYHNHRVDEELSRYRAKSDKATTSANTRWGSKNKALAKRCERIAKAKPTHSEGNANNKSLIINKTIEIPFDKFWSLYPRKSAKAAANKVWSKLCNNDKIDALDKLPRHIAKWTDPQFIPHATTWLNQKRWEDVLEVNVVTAAAHKTYEPKVETEEEKKENARRATEQLAKYQAMLNKPKTE